MAAKSLSGILQPPLTGPERTPYCAVGHRRGIAKGLPLLSRGLTSRKFWLRAVMALSVFLCAVSPALAQNICYVEASDDGGRQAQRIESIDNRTLVARHGEQSGFAGILTGQFTPSGYSLAALPVTAANRLNKVSTTSYSKPSRVLANRGVGPGNPPPLL